MLQIGDKAPEFNLKGYLKNKIKDYSSKEFKGKWIVLFYYPADFTFVCPTEVMSLSNAAEEFKKLNSVVLGISTDSVYSHQKWSEELGGLDIALLSDFHKRTSRDYNVLDEDSGESQRGLFIIDPEGTLRYFLVSDGSVGRSTPELLRVISALQTGKLCPAEWKPGEATL
ncbi:MAG: peroxiredoxin [Patescibacteria group bacterium]|nr:peroxiredoxin [Patescibacteria group bacterium]